MDSSSVALSGGNLSQEVGRHCGSLCRHQKKRAFCGLQHPTNGLPVHLARSFCLTCQVANRQPSNLGKPIMQMQELWRMEHRPGEALLTKLVVFPTQLWLPHESVLLHSRRQCWRNWPLRKCHQHCRMLREPHICFVIKGCWLAQALYNF